MARKPYIKSVRFGGFLSFPPDMPDFELKPLNVLIGPNAGGKSNFLHGMRLLKSCAKDIREAVRDFGGADEVFYKGPAKAEHLDLSCLCAGASADDLVTYSLFIEKLTSSSYVIAQEQLVVEDSFSNDRSYVKILHWSHKTQQPIATRTTKVVTTDYAKDSHLGPSEDVSVSEYEVGNQVRNLFDAQEQIKPELPLLAQLHGWLYSVPARDVKEILDGIWVNDLEKTNSINNVRMEQFSDFPRSYPLVSFKNIGVILSEIKKDRVLKDKMFEYIKRVIPRFIDLDIDPHGNKLMILMHEDGIADPIPATRLSDGTLSFIYLALLLLHPTPPSVICLEEPDAGLHPDAVHIVAELLIDASKRTQVVCTTHSSLLVSAIGDQHPEAIVVCERDEEGTKLKRLDADKMEKWLEEFSLGDLWMKGEIGGDIRHA